MRGLDFLRTRLVRPSQAMAAVGALLLAAVIAGASFSLWQARQAAWEQAAQAGRNVALSLERDIARNVELYDLSLRAAVDGLRLLEEGGATLSPAAERAVLFDRSTTGGHFGPILVLDDRGTVLRDSGSPEPRVWSLADRDYFAVHRAEPTPDLFVTPTQRSRISGKPGLVLSRRLDRPDGTFAGVVVGGIALDYIRTAFEGLDLGSGSVVSLYGTDGRLVLRHPRGDRALGRDISASPLFQAFIQSGSAGISYEGSSLVDGIERLYANRRVGALPLVVSVGVPLEAVYAGWHRQVVTAVIGLVVFVLLAAGLALALRRELRQRKRMETAARGEAEAARLNEAKLRTYFKHLADGLLVIRVEPDGRFIYERINAAAQDMLGMSADRAVGREPHEVWPEAYAREIEERLRDCVEADGPIRYETVREMPGSASRRVLRLILAAVRDAPSAEHPRGRPVLLLGSVRDATREVELDAQLLQAQRMEAVGQLTAGIAHDFNNLLQAQMGGLELLMDEVQGQPRAEEYAAMALSAGERGARLTHSLLAFSRQQVLRPERVDLPALLHGLQTMLSRTLDPRITLRVDMEAGLPRLLADPSQVEAAALNLCLNARDAMPRGGRLLVEAYDGRNALEVPSKLRAAEYLVLAVEDEGGGMPPEILSQACEPFFTTKGIGKGSGLGLSMVQGFARQSGGELRILSHPGHGTRVEIWLPKAAAPTAAPGPWPSATAATETRRRAQGRVLLVDDAPMVLQMLADLLDTAGYEVVQASSGEQAVTLLSGTKNGAEDSSGPCRGFDALVTDYAMPGMTGGELLGHAQSLAPDLPALVITGYADAATLDKVPPHVRVVHKPFRADVLVRHVQHLIEGAPKHGNAAPPAAAALPETFLAQES